MSSTFPPRAGVSGGAAVVLTVLLGVGIAAMAAALTLGALAVRSALATGACIEGGSSESGLPCPKGLIPSIPIVVGLGVLGAVLAFVSARRLAAPNALVVGWAALFLVLAWLFLDEGLLHPGEQGVRIGFVVLAVVFVGLAAGPFLPANRTSGRTGWSGGTSRATYWWLYYAVAAGVGVLVGVGLDRLLST